MDHLRRSEMKPFWNPCFILLFVTLITETSFPRIVDRIVAIVDKQVILESDLKTLQKNIKKGVLFDIEYAQFFDLEKLKKNTSIQLDYLISEYLFINYSKKNEIYSSIKKDLNKELKK